MVKCRADFRRRCARPISIQSINRDLLPAFYVHEKHEADGLQEKQGMNEVRVAKIKNRKLIQK